MYLLNDDRGLFYSVTTLVRDVPGCLLPAEPEEKIPPGQGSCSWAAVTQVMDSWQAGWISLCLAAQGTSSMGFLRFCVEVPNHRRIHHVPTLGRCTADERMDGHGARDGSHGTGWDGMIRPCARQRRRSGSCSSSIPVPACERVQLQKTEYEEESAEAGSRDDTNTQ